MDPLNADDLLHSMKLLGIQIPKDRLPMVADYLQQTLLAFRALDGMNLSKEFEPTTLIFLLLKGMKDLG